MPMDKIYETWGEIGYAMGYSATHAKRLFKELCRSHPKFVENLKHWLGPGRRIRMDHEEFILFKKLLAQGR